MGRNKKLLANSIVFTIGNLGSKFISFFMVPLYTYAMNTGQFGKVDLVITTVNLFLPVATLSLFDAVFRFGMDRGQNPSKVLTSGVLTTLFLSFIILLLAPFIGLLNISYLYYFLAILIVTSLFTLFQNFSRAIGKSFTYAIAGIINAIAFACLNVYFLIYLKMNVNGYLLSYFLAMFISLIYVVISLHAWQYIRLNSYSISLTKRMLMYSIPLIPNSLAWWLTNDASRYFILTFVGVAGNGLFAVANKIPSVINMFFNVFTQAWQISAVDEFKSKDRSVYYTSVFRSIQSVLFVLIALFLLIDKPFMHYFVAPSYYSAWKYIPFLLLSVAFSNISAFLGSVYLAAKKTSGIMYTTILGMIVNMVFSFILTPMIGIYGTSLSGALGFLVVVFLRLFDVKKFIKVKMDWKIFVGSIFGLLLMTLGLFSYSAIEFICLFLGCVVVLTLNREAISNMIKTVINTIFKGDR